MSEKQNPHSEVKAIGGQKVNSETYGSWESPITAELLAEGATSIGEVAVDGNLVWWSERRPKKGGRSVICCRLANGKVQEVTPEGMNVDSRVHSYGGAAWWVRNQNLVFADQTSGALYFWRFEFSLEPKPPRALTEKDATVQYGDGRITPDGRYFICVRERTASPENINDIVAISLTKNLSHRSLDRLQKTRRLGQLGRPQKIHVLASGADFYSSPRISPDGRHITWLQWNHPNMPWDGTELWLAELGGRSGRKLGRRLEREREREREHGRGQRERAQWGQKKRLRRKKKRAIKAKRTKNARKIAGGEAEWIFQPEWKSTDELVYVSDQNGWSALFSHHLKGQKVSGLKEALKEGEANFQILDLQAEIALPPWSLGESRYCFLKNGNLAYVARSSSRDTLYLGNQELTDYTSISQLRPYRDGVIALAGSWDREEELIYIKDTGATGAAGAGEGGGSSLEAEVLVASQEPDSVHDPGLVSAMALASVGTFETQPGPKEGKRAGEEPSGGAGKIDGESETGEGEEEGSGKMVGGGLDRKLGKGLDKRFFPAPEFLEFQSAYALYYEPANPAYPRSQQKPPLIVMAHGGPTGDARTSLYLGHRFWTSRGFAVLDVNYRGSTGFGRDYRQSLYGEWGRADIEDCIAATEHIIQSGRVNPDQIMIRGSSSGGLTVLMALALSDIFSCAAIRYGVVDLKALDETTHKFESRYVERLIGTRPDDRPKAAENIYQERSPIHHIEKINTPMIIMSGTEDPIVPPAQSQMLADALKARGLKHELVMFDGEGHGFRKSENQIRATNAELNFVKEVFGLA